jgi:hypothetical protein
MILVQKSLFKRLNKNTFSVADGNIGSKQEPFNTVRFGLFKRLNKPYKPTV